MSEAQGRYLFRLLAEDGFEGKQAQRELLRVFGVRDLREVSSARASQQLDAWTGKHDQATTHGRAEPRD